MPTIYILDAHSGQEIVRNANKGETQVLLEEQRTFEIEQAQRQAAAAEAAAAKQAILDRLGLTAEEAKMLLS